MILASQQAYASASGTGGGGIFYCDFPATAGVNGGYEEPANEWYTYAATATCDDAGGLLKIWIFRPGDAYEKLDVATCKTIQTKMIPLYKGRVKRELCPYQSCASHKFVAYIPLMWTLENAGVKQEGLWLEFGVAHGFSLNVTSLHKLKKSPVSVFGFDTFEGLPESWSTGWGTYHRGSFSQGGVIPLLEDGIGIEKGLFNETLDAFLTIHKEEEVSFVNIDMDLYSGAVYVLTRLVPHFSDGCIVHFHELTNDAMKGLDELRALYDIVNLFPHYSWQLLLVYGRGRSTSVFRVTKNKV